MSAQLIEALDAWAEKHNVRFNPAHLTGSAISRDDLLDLMHAAMASAEAQPAGPLPGMSEAFEAWAGVKCWTDPAYAPDTSTWAAAWEAATSAQQGAAPLTECNTNDSPWLICKTCAARGKCAKAEEAKALKPLTLEQIERHIGADEGDREAVVAIVREVETWHGIGAASPICQEKT